MDRIESGIFEPGIFLFFTAWPRGALVYGLPSESCSRLLTAEDAVVQVGAVHAA